MANLSNLIVTGYTRFLNKIFTKDVEASGNIKAPTFTGDLTGNVTGNVSGTAGSVAWGNVSGKPTTFPSTAHTHDDRYYTETEMDTKLSGKAPSSHTHTKSQISDFPTIPSVGNGTVTITQNGTTKGSFTLNQSGNATIALTDTDTNTTYGLATQSVNGLLGATDKKKLDGIATSAEVNQNAFSNVKIGTVTVAADTKTDTLELVAGSNVTITPDATTDKITISSVDTKYTHPSTHAASMITQDTTHRFVTDAEKNKWTISEHDYLTDADINLIFS